jgi:uncharacterized protein YqgV (UPF0045/DUF77 family)
MENITNPVEQITVKANSLLKDALDAAARAEETLKHVDMDTLAKARINKAAKEVSDIASAIDAMRVIIEKERQPLLDALSQALEQVNEFKVQVDMMHTRIRAKEEEIKRLEQQHKEVLFPLLGKFTIPDPEALPRIAALKMEVAGLYTAMSVSKTALATAEQGVCAIREQLLSSPVEADPRIAGLQRSLDVARNMIDNLLEKHTGAFQQEIVGLFSDDNKKLLLDLMRKNIPAGLPGAISEAIFMDALQKMEKLLVEILPAELIGMMKDETTGVNGKLDHLVNRLTEKINKEIDLPLLDEEQEAWLFHTVIDAITRSMKKGHLIDTVLSEFQ